MFANQEEELKVLLGIPLKVERSDGRGNSLSKPIMLCCGLGTDAFTLLTHLLPLATYTFYSV